MKNSSTMNTLLISTETIKDMYPVKNLDDAYIVPSIVLAQDEGLQMVLGSNLVERLKGLVESGDIELPEFSHYKELLDKHVTPYLTWMTLAKTVFIVHFKLRNSGAVTNMGDHIQTSTRADADQLQNLYEKNAAFYGDSMQKWILANKELFPELDCCCDEYYAGGIRSGYAPRQSFGSPLYMEDYA